MVAAPLPATYQGDAGPIDSPEMGSETGSPPEEQLPGLETLGSTGVEAVQGPSGRRYSGKAFFCLAPATPLRRNCIRLVESWCFEPFILSVIVMNVVTMAITSPVDEHGTSKEAFIDLCESVYLAIFTFEMLSKMIAYGLLFTEEAYLTDSWCQLDFTVVTLAWAPIIFPGFGNFSGKPH